MIVEIGMGMGKSSGWLLFEAAFWTLLPRSWAQELEGAWAQAARASLHSQRQPRKSSLTLHVLHNPSSSLGGEWLCEPLRTWQSSHNHHRHGLTTLLLQILRVIIAATSNHVDVEDRLRALFPHCTVVHQHHRPS